MIQNLPFSPITENNWNTLIRSLRRKVNPEQAEADKLDCILILGPEALLSNVPSDDQDFKPLLDCFCEEILERLKTDHKMDLEGAPDLAHFRVMERFRKAYGGDAETVYEELYQRVYTLENIHPVFHKKLPFVPFPLIINTSHDELLRDAFVHAGMHDVKSSYFSYKNNPQKKLKPPTVENPVIYNLFGSISDPQSMVTVPGDLLEYVFSIIQRGEDQLDKIVTDAVRDAKHIIFLGFDFESWHLKILLRYFKINYPKTDQPRVVTYARPWKLESRETEEFFKNTFNVTFVKDDVVEFIENLHDRCARNPGMLRTPTVKKQASFRDRLSDLVADGKIDQAFGMWKEYGEGNEVAQEDYFKMVWEWGVIQREYLGKPELLREETGKLVSKMAKLISLYEHE